MTVDLREMSALEYLSWIDSYNLRVNTSGNGSTDLGAHSIVCYTRAGVYDLNAIYKRRERGSLRGVHLLTDDGRRDFTPPLTDHDLDLLPLVGAEVYLTDRDNLDDWATIARRWDEARTDFGHYVRSQEPRTIVTEFLRAGRGPSYARRVLASAIAHNVDPRAYGFEVSAEEWESLAENGVEDAQALAAYTDAGCSLAEAVRLSAEGVAPGATVVAQRESVPREQWVARLSGIPADWLPYGVSDGWPDDGEKRHDPAEAGTPLALGHTLDDLKAYADAGWKISRWQWSALHYGTGSRSGGSIQVTPKIAKALLHAGMTPDDLSRWAAAVIASSRGTYRKEVPSLAARWRWHDDDLDAVTRLHQRGVRPSHVNHYRYCGATSFDLVNQALDAGVTPSRVAYLRDKYGEGENKYDRTKRLAFTALLRHHEEDK